MKLLGICYLCLAPKATCEFHNLLEVAQKLCRLCTWALVWYELEDTLRPVVELIPGIVVVRPIPGQEAENILNPSRRQPKARAKRVAQQTQSDPGSAEVAGDIVDEAFVDLFGDESPEEQEPDLEEEMDEQQLEEMLLLRAEAMEELTLQVQQKVKKEKHDKGKTTQAKQMQASGGVVSSSSTAHPATASSSEPVQLEEVPMASVEPDPPAIAENTVLARVGGFRTIVGPAEAEIKLPNGRIAFHTTKQSFECRCDVHPSCVLTRGKAGRKVKGYEDKQGGRPLGFMALWLAKAKEYDSAIMHKEKAFWSLYTHEDRAVARASLAETAGGRSLLELEKPKAHASDPDEPAMVEPKIVAGSTGELRKPQTRV
eukprot:6492754-Amphidinium_carterae.5